MCASPNPYRTDKPNTYYENYSPEFNMKLDNSQNPNVTKQYVEKYYDNPFATNSNRSPRNGAPPTNQMPPKQVYESPFSPQYPYQPSEYDTTNSQRRQSPTNFQQQNFVFPSGEADMSLSSDPRMQRYLNAPKYIDKENMIDHTNGYASQESQKTVDSPFSSKNYKAESPYAKNGNPTFTNTTVSNNSLKTSESQKRMPKPIIILNVDIGQGRSEELYVFDDDEPVNVARDFCQRFGLNPNIIPILTKNIQAQLQVYNDRKQEKLKRMAAERANNYPDDRYKMQPISEENTRPSSRAQENIPNGYKNPFQQEQQQQYRPNPQPQEPISNSNKKAYPDQQQSRATPQSQMYAPSNQAPSPSPHNQQGGMLHSYSSKQLQQLQPEPKIPTNGYSRAEMTKSSMSSRQPQPQPNPAQAELQQYFDQASQKSSNGNGRSTPTRLEYREPTNGNKNGMPSKKQPEPTTNRRTNPMDKSPGRSNYPPEKSPSRSQTPTGTGSRPVQHQNGNRTPRDAYDDGSNRYKKATTPGNKKLSNNSYIEHSPFRDDESMRGHPKMKRAYSTKSLKSSRTDKSHDYSDEEDSDLNSEFQNAKEAAFQRLYKNGQVTNQRKKEALSYRQGQEVEDEDYSYKPKINQVSDELAKRRKSNPREDINYNRTKMEKREKAAQIREKLEIAACSFKPDIESSSKRSVQSARNDTNKDKAAYKRLYEAASLKDRKIQKMKEEQLKKEGNYKPKLLAKNNNDKYLENRKQHQSPEYMYSNGEKPMQQPSSTASIHERLNKEKLKKDLVGPRPLTSNKSEASLKAHKDPQNKDMTFQPKINKDKYYQAAKQRSEKTIQHEVVEMDEQALMENMQSNKAQMRPKKSGGNGSGGAVVNGGAGGVPSMPPMQRDEVELPPEIKALKDLFDTLDDDHDGRITIHNAGYLKLSGNLLEIVSPILFNLEDQGSMNFEDFCEIAYKENVIPRLKEIYGIRESYESKGRQEEFFQPPTMQHEIRSSYESNESKGQQRSHHSSEQSEGSTQRFGTLPYQQPQQEEAQKMKTLTKKYQEVARKSFNGKS
jgi:hypothetical protein